MTFLVYLVIAIGIISSAAHLILVRPSNPFSPASINANGWVMIVLLVYLRNLVLLLLSASNHYTEFTFYSVFGVITGFIVDCLMIYRLVSFARYKRDYESKL